METLEIIVSKANSIRFANRDGKLPSMDNLLSGEELDVYRPGIYYEQIYFHDDVVLVQVKAGLTATVELVQHFETGLKTTHTATAVTTYTNFKIYEYVITFDYYGKSTFVASSEESEWVSECINIIDPEDGYILVQWTNFDTDSNNFEFDYTTPLAEAHVNYIRIEGEAYEYDPSSEVSVYDNQNEKSIIKAYLYNKIKLQTEMIPRHFAEKLAIAVSHDRFLVNDVAYVVEKTPTVTPNGNLVQLTADMTVNLSLGMNTHDIGFNCDGMASELIKNIVFLDKSTNQSGSVSEGYSINQIIIALNAGATVTVKIGSTVGGDDILREYTLTTSDPFKVLTRNFVTPTGISGAWTAYITITGGGSADVYIQTIKSDE